MNTTRLGDGGTYFRITLPQEFPPGVYNDANQLNQRGASTLTYDANGNLTDDGVSTYAWDARNQLKFISAARLSASFTYDAFGRRKRKCCKIFE